MSATSIPEPTRISADRYQKMVATGVLTKYDRVELIDGDIIDMPPIGLSHAAVTARLNKLYLTARLLSIRAPSAPCMPGTEWRNIGWLMSCP
jgi:hypothetical protein